ncbi:hypothetical protein [uncultured Neptuniibacter sp.]|uniref:hypothetical protein n=1 Tax=uncultured Neptuniibacter sp. TaxID=502143 RepID=UPI00262B2B3B|nr:hypothetical protein [uncultured Neptuniibacter sp.]
MKIGPVEGTPEEVNNFFQNNGLNPLDYFEKPESSLQTRWLIIPALLFVASFVLLALVGDDYSKTKVVLFLSGFASSVWLAVCVHIRFKTAWGAGAIIFAGLLIMLVALGVLEPKQLTEYYQNEKSHNK